MAKRNEVHLNAPQTRFIDAIQDNRYILFGAGVGTGKTSLARWMAIYLAQANPGQPGLIVSHNLQHCKVEIVDKLVDILQATRQFKSRNINERTVTLRNGTKIVYGSGDRPSSVDGNDVAWCLGDEIRYWKKETYTKFISRARIKDAPLNRVLCFSTLEDNWMREEWEDKEKRLLVRATTYDNAHNLTDDYIPDLKRSLSQQEFDQYVLAKWGTSGKLVFSGWDDNIHICDLPIFPGIPIDVAVDPGVTRSAIGMAQTIPFCPIHNTKECVHWIDELMLDDLATLYLPKKIDQHFRVSGYKRGDMIIDPAAKARSTQTGIPDIHLFTSEGWNVKFRTDAMSKYIPNGIQLMRGKINPADSKPSMYFSDKLSRKGRGLIPCMKKSEYPDLKNRPALDEPIKDGWLDHARDVVRYYLTNKIGIQAARIQTIANYGNPGNDSDVDDLFGDDGWL